jgi:uroporphyrinogen decarboxylase
MEPTHRFLRACLRLPVDRTPAWMMRQAGRYLPQYRAVRQRASFLDLCKNPDLSCEVTLQPIDEYSPDAAILFCDILIPLEAMGMSLEFTEEGPKLPSPVRDRTAIDRLGVPDPEATMPFVLEAVRRIRKALADRVPLIGFAGAPFTLAAYAVEGGGSQNYLHLKRLLFSDRRSAHLLLDKLAATVALYLEAQVAAGAQAVQIFDTWAGILSPVDYDEFALRQTKAVIDALRASPTWSRTPVPIIYYVNGGAPLLERMRRTGADVIGLDWKTDLADARRRLPGVAVQGNMDPTYLFASKAEIEARVRDILEAGRVEPGHVFNLGHGVLPPTDPEHVRAMFEAVRKHGVRTS